MLAHFFFFSRHLEFEFQIWSNQSIRDNVLKLNSIDEVLNPNVKMLKERKLAFTRLVYPSTKPIILTLRNKKGKTRVDWSATQECEISVVNKEAYRGISFDTRYFPLPPSRYFSSNRMHYSPRLEFIAGQAKMPINPRREFSMPLLLLLGASESYRFPRFPVRIVDPSISRGEMESQGRGFETGWIY